MEQHNSHVIAYYSQPYPYFGKFEGERLALVKAYENSLDGCCESFGDCETVGFYCAAYAGELEIYFVEDSQGFVTELNASQYAKAETAYEAMLEESEEGDDD
jgi:hypothetical protein